MWKVFIIVILIILILWIGNIIINNNCDKVYNKINHDNDIENSKNYLNNMAYKYNRNALDNYRIANIYDFVLHDQTQATAYYLEALKQNDTYVRDRIRDRIIINNDTEEDTYRLDDIMILEQELEELENILEKSLEKPPKPTVKWVSDSQNVHDSNINNEVKDQFTTIWQYNINNDIYIWSVSEIKQYIDGEYREGQENKKELDNIQDALRMLDYILAYNSEIMKIQMKETSFISQVFSRIMASDKKNTLLENFILNLKDCYSEGQPVCITGRLTRIMSSFANIDDDGVGVIRSKQVIRNEILTKSSTVRETMLNAAGEEIAKKYNSGVTDADTVELIKSMREEIDLLITRDYEHLFKHDPNYLNNLKNEINTIL